MATFVISIEYPFPSGGRKGRKRHSPISVSVAVTVDESGLMSSATQCGSNDFLECFINFFPSFFYIKFKKK